MIRIVNKKNSCYVLTSLVICFLIPTKLFAGMSPWQGPYIGAYFGGGYSSNHTSTNVGAVTDTSYFTTATDINAIHNAGTTTQHPSAAIIGITAGHDWVSNQFGYGVVFDYGTLPLNSSKSQSNRTYLDNSDQYAIHTSMRTNWLFTLRGRLGYQTVQYWPAFFYVTSGIAITQLQVNNSFNDTSSLAGSGGNQTAQNQIGWTGGIGAEVLSFGHASVSLEYLYVKVPSVKSKGSISNSEAGFGIPAQSQTSPFSTTGQFHANLIKVGLNYRFDE